VRILLLSGPAKTMFAAYLLGSIPLAPVVFAHSLSGCARSVYVFSFRPVVVLAIKVSLFAVLDYWVWGPEALLNLFFVAPRL